MNTQKEVFNKLFKEEKTELATQKVELGIVQDIQKDIEFGLSKGYEMIKSVNKISSTNKELTKIESKYNSLIKSVNSDLETFNFTRADVVAAYNRASSKYTEIVNKSSDLGVDVPSKVEQGFKELDKLYNKQKKSYPKENALKRKQI